MIQPYNNLWRLITEQTLEPIRIVEIRMTKRLPAMATVMLISSVNVPAHDIHSSATHLGLKNDSTNTLRTSKALITEFAHNWDKRPNSHIKKFNYEPDLGNSAFIYIIQLNALPIAQHEASAKILRQSKVSYAKLIDKSPINTQLDVITKQRSTFLQKATALVPSVAMINEYSYALNGFTVRITQAQAQKLAELPEVLRITRDNIRKTSTDQGPTLIGAPAVWDGSAFTPVAPTQGEGVTIGILDTGINTDHPSFAETSGDGFLHTNPLGDGVFLGDCAIRFPELCNNKLIGVYSFPVITDNYTNTNIFPPNLPANGEDYGGHGSHVAAIAAGNVLNNVDEVLPDPGQQESSGIPTGTRFSQLSGVAPRANIISYQVCFGGRSDANDTFGDCRDSAVLQGIEAAIRDQVDVLNYSVSGGGNPWQDPIEIAFLSARNAGIFVATSAGNSGPDVGSTDKNAPWYTSVAASEHGRQNAFVKQLNNFSGGSNFLASITGQSNSSGITERIVYAGDFTNSNDPGGDPAQCLAPFPSDTFSGQIVVCDRGEIARVDKAINVEAGGAGGYVLANVQGGTSFLANDQYVVPGIHINADDGDMLKAWLRSGSDHRATITAGSGGQTIDPARVDVLAGFSSRGPNNTNSTLTPSLTAPGVDIYAAFADQQFGHDGHTPSASDFNYLSGTSMASPHVAGAAALLASAHPDWGPDAIRSALSMTASALIKRADASTNADYFDMGAGRIQVDQAIASGLIMNETAINYANADPDINGDPRSLNLPSITDNACQSICTWTRTFTATTNATWDIATTTISEGMSVSASPESFTLTSGQSQTVTFVIDATEASKTDYSFATATLTSPGLPDINIPISVLSSIGNIPLDVDIFASRSIDSLLLTDIDAIDIPSFNLTPYKLVKSTVQLGLIEIDSNNGDVLDDLNDGVVSTQVIVPENSKRITVEITQSNARDLDLYLALDENNDGVISSTEIIANSLTSNSIEAININYPDAGTYTIILQNFGAPNGRNELQEATYELRYGVVSDVIADEDEFTVIAPNSLDHGSGFDLRFIHNLGDSVVGDKYYGAVDMGSDAQGSQLGMIAVDISHTRDDVIVDGEPARVEAGQGVPLKVVVAPNTTNEIRDYRIAVPLPVGTEFSSFSTSNEGQVVNNQILWRVNKAAGDISATTLNFDLRMLDGVLPGPISVNANSELLNQNFSQLESSPIFTKIQVEGSPVLSFNNQATGQFTITETRSLMIPIQIDEPNGDEVNVVWTQTQGPSAAIEETDGVFSLTAPRVDANTELAYDVVVTDIGGNNTTSSIVVSVRNNAIPVISAVNAPQTANGGETITVSVNTSDPDGDLLNISINGDEITGSSTSLITPTTGSSVSYVVRVSDGIDSVEETLSVSLTQTASEPSEGSDDSGGSMPLWLIGLFGLVFLRNYKHKLGLD